MKLNQALSVEAKKQIKPGVKAIVIKHNNSLLNLPGKIDFIHHHNGLLRFGFEADGKEQKSLELIDSRDIFLIQVGEK